MRKRYIKYHYDDLSCWSPEDEYKKFPTYTTDEEITKDFKVWSEKIYEKRCKSGHLIDPANFKDESAYLSALKAIKTWYINNLDDYWEELTETEFKERRS